MAGAISVDQFSPVFQRFDFTLGFVYVTALCIMLDSDPDRRGRTSVCHRITPFLDQRKIREVDVCVCVFTDWAKTPSVTQSLYSGLALR